jgi:Zn-dependent protease
MADAVTTAAVTCADCGSEIGAGLLGCPACRKLLHGHRLKRLAADAEAARQRGDVSTAIAAWRSALELLPPDSRQFEATRARISELSRQLDGRAAQGKQKAGWKREAAKYGPLGALLLKFKTILLFVLTKVKLLVLGLSKFGTLASMLLSFAVYWKMWGWKFALGFVLCIYVHEMGHVFELRRYGISATAPMFIPGFGALVRLNQLPHDAREDARIGLAGPIWGFAASIFCYFVFRFAGQALWLALARTSAWINLFNLLPFWQLDGSRGFRALSQAQRFAVTGSFAAMWFFTGDGMLLILVLVAAWRAFDKRDLPPTPDPVSFYQFVSLIAFLSVLASIPVPGMQVDNTSLSLLSHLRQR